jgi:hypothetical protein
MLELPLQERAIRGVQFATGPNNNTSTKEVENLLIWYRRRITVEASQKITMDVEIMLFSDPNQGK